MRRTKRRSAPRFCSVGRKSERVRAGGVVEKAFVVRHRLADQVVQEALHAAGEVWGEIAA